MNTKPKLTIIVPTYNAENYIRECVDSILAQTYQDFELLLIDDGSTDSSSEILDHYAISDPRIRVIHQENLGLVATRKVGVLEAQGELIGFVDADDRIAPTMYEEMLTKQQEHDADMVCCGVNRWGEDGSLRPIPQTVTPGFYDKTRLKSEVYPHMLYSGEFYESGLLPAYWNKIYQKSLLQPILEKLPSTLRMGEDVACTYSCLLAAERVYLLTDQPLYDYRKLIGSMTSAWEPGYMPRIDALLTFLYDTWQIGTETPVVPAEHFAYYGIYLITSVATHYLFGMWKSMDAEKRNRDFAIIQESSWGHYLYSLREELRLPFFKRLLLEVLFHKNPVYIWVAKAYYKIRRLG